MKSHHLKDHNCYWKLYGSAKTYTTSGVDVERCSSNTMWAEASQQLESASNKPSNPHWPCSFISSCLISLGWLHGQYHNQSRGWSSWALSIGTADQGWFSYICFDSLLISSPYWGFFSPWVTLFSVEVWDKPWWLVMLYQLSSVGLWPTQLVTDPEEEAAASPASLGTSSTGIAKRKEHNPCSSATQHKRGASLLCPDQPLHLANKECVYNHVLFHMGNALLDWIFWFVSVDVWLTSQSGVEAHDLGSFQVSPKWNMMQKHCRNTANVLQTMMDQTVYGMWLKLAWSKCLETGAEERSLAPTVSLHRPAAVRSLCFLRKHGQRLQTLWLYHQTHLLDDGVTLGNGLITRQFSPCTEKRILPLSSQNTDAIIQVKPLY